MHDSLIFVQLAAGLDWIYHRIGRTRSTVHCRMRNINEEGRGSGRPFRYKPEKHGVVQDDIVGCMINCTLINSRMISIRTAPKQKCTIIQMYVPASAHRGEEIETQFYSRQYVPKIA